MDPRGSLGFCHQAEGARPKRDRSPVTPEGRRGENGMKANGQLSVALAVIAALGICLPSWLPSGADAGQITFGPSLENVTFTGNGARSVSISISGLTGPGFYTGDALVGAFKFGPTSFTAGPGPDIYPASSSAESFEFTGSDHMTG